MSNSSLAAGNDPVAESIRRAVSGYAAAWLAGDRQAMLASYHDDFTLHYFGRNPLAGIHRGKPAALAILAEVTRRSKRKLSGIVDVMADPNAARCWSAKCSSVTARRRRWSACWSTRFATNCSGNAGSTTRIRRSSTRFSPRRRRRVRPRRPQTRRHRSRPRAGYEADGHR